MNVQELLWKYAEGACDSAESEKVEELLFENEDLRIELEQIKTLHAALSKMVPDTPSLRFVQNLMEVLPNIYTDDSLVPSFWKKLGIGVFLFILVSGYISWSQQPMSDNTLPKLAPLVENLSGWLGQIPSSLPLYLFLTITAAGLLALLDIFIEKVQKKQALA